LFQSSSYWRMAEKMQVIFTGIVDGGFQSSSYWRMAEKSRISAKVLIMNRLTPIFSRKF